MPLNISIDVGGTLLEAGEQPPPDIREHLQRLKSQGHHLQLWSTGGVDYALRKAKAQGLADLFESFATKPDVAIDDIPESVRPVATLKVDDKFLLAQAIKSLESEIEGCVESVLCPSQALKEFVAEMQKEKSQVRATLGDLLIPGTPLHPVPFFGNIESAHVITVGLNPAITEFGKHRGWKSALVAEDLTFRLVNYFRLAGICYPTPHSWFGDISEFLHIIGCPQEIATAHVDLCPWTSIAPIGLTAPRRNRFWNLVDEQMERWLVRTLTYAKRTVKLVVILESPNAGPQEEARQVRTKGLINEAFGAGWRGKIRIKKREDLVDWAWMHRTAFRKFIGLSRVID
jgi:hypothetical protein